VGLREWAVPQDGVFFDLFEKMADTVNDGAVALVGLLQDYTSIPAKCQAMEEIEHRGDAITHEIHEHLNRTFITPLEPEEITALASALDDVLDTVEGVAQQMRSYGIAEADAVMKESAQLIQLCTAELAGAVKGLRTMQDVEAMGRNCIEINRLENLADEVLANAITDLFRTRDAVEIIKRKDIYENLELATDKCEDAANIISDIILRHS